MSIEGVTNAQLAAWIGCVPSTIQTWKSGSKPNRTFAWRISKLFNNRYSINQIQRADGISLVKELKKAYIKAGRPFEHISGRDFTDERRENFKTWR